MASITIRKLDDALKARLRVQAARHGRSMEEEARAILKAGMEEEPERPRNAWEAIRRHIEPLGGVELELPLRELIREPPDFGIRRRKLHRKKARGQTPGTRGQKS